MNALIEAALRAQKNAYCPHSRYAVGAAVLARSGRIYPGCNVESPTLISHICAERSAIFNALAHGERELLAISTASRSSVPCGACRQAIMEFGGDIPIYSLVQGSAGRRKVIRTRVSRLLPRAHTARTISRRAP